MPAAGKPDHETWPANETELQTCLRRYKSDSLIAWHLGIPKAAVTAARARYVPPKSRGSWVSHIGEVDDTEFLRRRKKAERSNSAYLEAVKGMQRA